MSFYSDSNVTTHYLDPSTYLPQSNTSDGRVSFELDGTKLAFLPNMRLLNVGCHSDSLQVYNSLVGAYTVIERIRLLDGDTELSALTNQQLYRGFKNQNAVNSLSESVESRLSKNSVGWSVDGFNRVIGRVTKVGKTGPAGGSQILGYLDLREVFPILNSVSHLPTSVFKNLNIQIIMTGKLTDQVLLDITAAIVPVRPILAVDVLENPKIVQQMRKSLEGARWLEVEHDRFLIPESSNNNGQAADQGIVQSTNVKINGFNNKHLERLVIVKELTDPSVYITNQEQVGWGRWGSPACFKQTVQFRLNGRNILPRNGIVGNNERLAYMIDTFGDCAVYPGSNLYGLGSVAAGSAAGGVLADVAYIGQSDYIGIYLGDYINDLQINYSRVGLEDTGAFRPTTSPLYAHCYGEVAKVLAIRGDNTYNVVYAQN